VKPVERSENNNPSGVERQMNEYQVQTAITSHGKKVGSKFIFKTLKINKNKDTFSDWRSGGKMTKYRIPGNSLGIVMGS
jgi:hypothetical protein